MRSPAFVVAATFLGLLGAACGGSTDAAPSASPSAGTAPEVHSFLSLCSMSADVAAGDVASAEATFQDDVHETLHELADRLGSTDRAIAAAVLEATSKVEADLAQAEPDPAKLGTDVGGLTAAMSEALGAAGFEVPACPEVSP
jgi:hypothetical protein